MIYARLMLARDLLSADGLLFVSIDDHEEENLRKICDEIFGEESFAACAPRKTGAGSAATRSASELRKMNDFVLIYRKTPNAAFRKLIVGEKEYPYTDQWGDFKLAQFQASGSDATRAARPNMYYPLFISNDARIELEQSPYGDLREILPEKVNGEDGRWLWRPEKVTQDKEHYLTVKDGHVFRKIYYNPNEDQTLYQVEKAWFDNYRNADGTKELAALLEEKQLFSNPKPVGLIKKLISMHPDNNALVLDFFSGSGTTAQAIMEQNKEDGGERRFILVQYPEPVDSGTRTYNLGYHNICEIGEERIRRAGERIKSEVEQENQQLKLDSEPQRVPDIGFRVLRVDSSNYKDVHRTPAETTQGALDEFVDVSKTDRESLDKLFECFPTFQLPYDSSIEVLSGPAFANHTVYSVNGGQLVACFDAEIPESVLRGMAALDPKPSYAVVAQAGLKNSQTVTNFEEIFKQSANAQQGSTQTRII